MPGLTSGPGRLGSGSGGPCGVGRGSRSGSGSGGGSVGSRGSATLKGRQGPEAVCFINTHEVFRFVCSLIRSKDRRSHRALQAAAPHATLYEGAGTFAGREASASCCCGNAAARIGWPLAWPQACPVRSREGRESPADYCNQAVSKPGGSV